MSDLSKVLIVIQIVYGLLMIIALVWGVHKLVWTGGQWVQRVKDTQDAHTKEMMEGFARNEVDHKGLETVLKEQGERLNAHATAMTEVTTKLEMHLGEMTRKDWPG